MNLHERLTYARELWPEHSDDELKEIDDALMRFTRWIYAPDDESPSRQAKMPLTEPQTPPSMKIRKEG